jgi:hypothetical protein
MGRYCCELRGILWRDASILVVKSSDVRDVGLVDPLNDERIDVIFLASAEATVKPVEHPFIHVRESLTNHFELCFCLRTRRLSPRIPRHAMKRRPCT